jgi:hypothetical protein
LPDFYLWREVCCPYDVYRVLADFTWHEPMPIARWVVLIASPGYAQQFSDESDGDDIVVTGERIDRPVLDTASSVSVLNTRDRAHQSLKLPKMRKIAESAGSNDQLQRHPFTVAVAPMPLPTKRR